jgi:exopolysaccharide production protein ExoY
VYQSNALKQHVYPSSHVRQGSDLNRSFYRLYGKRCFDVGFCFLFAPMVFLLIGVVACVVAATGQPPFFTQERIGKGGRVFKMWKIRTMRPHGQNDLQDYLARNPQAQAEWRRSQKLRHDPRVTKVGRFLRCTSLDELPQFVNVLRGEMSLVGPRPMLVVQKALYKGEKYESLRPGISGNWQISSRNRAKFSERADFDNRYFGALSLAEDLRILKATVGVVLRATGC